MRILLATEYPEDPNKIPGGVSAVAVNLAQAMSRGAELDVHVLTRCYERKQDRTEQRDGATIHFFSTPTPKIGSRVFREAPKIKRIVQRIRPDVVHAHLLDYVYPCLQMGLPTVWTPHGVTAHQVQGWGTWNGRVRGLIYGHLEQESLRMARHIIAISPFIEQSFRARTGARFHAIENPVDGRFFESREPGLPGRLLFVGTIHHRKGLDLLIDILPRVREQVPEVTLDVVGPVLERAYYARLLAAVRRHRLGETVRFVGIRTGSELLSRYAQAEIVVLPSRVDTAPTVISEAMAAMRPVVAASVGGIPWMVKEGETGFLVPSENREILAERILALLRDPALRKEMGEKARGEATGRFSPRSVIENTLQVYRQATGEVPSGSGEGYESESADGRYWARLWAGTSHDPRVLKREVNSKRFRRVLEYIRAELGDPATLRVAEIGSGLGYNAVLMARLGAHVTLIDMDATVLEKARSFFRNEPVKEPDIVCGDIFQLQETLADRFDVVMSFGVAEHFLGEERRGILGAHVRMARPGGLAVVSVPHRHAPLYRFQKATLDLLRMWPMGYGYFSRSGTHRSAPEYPFSRREMRTLTKDLPLASLDLEGVAFLEPVEDFLRIFRYVLEKLQAKDVADPFRLPDLPVPVLDNLFGKHLLFLARKSDKGVPA